MPPAPILHIEDNFHYRRLIRKLLESQGYDLIEAEDGLTGLDLIRSVRPVLVLVDIGLPGLDGVSVMRQVKADPTLCHIPLIALTAAIFTGDRERLLGVGFDGYLSKPVPLARLLVTLKPYLGEPGFSLKGPTD
jgi:two-component system, cell cycle response regulator DivK